MSEDKRICPRCKGCGTIPPKKKRTYSDDPTKKWCNLCKQFKDRVKDFYGVNGVTGYCKPCQNNRNREKRKKYKNNCYGCGKRFLGYRVDQLYCSHKCSCAAMRKKKKYHAYSKLPNELRDQVLNEEGF